MMKILDIYKNPLYTLFQWDVNQYVNVVGINPEMPVSAQFWRAGQTEAFVVESTVSGNTVTAAIPNELLREPGELVIYIWQDTGAGEQKGGRTETFFNVPIKERAQPSDYIYDDNVEYISVKTVIEDAKNATTAAQEATEAATSAAKNANNTAADIKQRADSGEFDGFTPEIGENGNWYINNIDTGKPSVGKIPEIIPINQGGTGNNIGYIQTGKLSSTTAGEKATIEGVDNKASGKYSHAEGKKNFAKGNYSHAEGSNMNYDETELNNRKITSNIIPGLSEAITISGTSAYGMSSHAEGAQTLAFGDCSHAEGTWCVSGDKNAHSEGYNSQAVGDCSHAEGADTKASGAKSHAEGEFTRAEGAQSHSEGYRTVAKGACCHVQGRCNTIDNNSKYLHIVGNGVSDSNRKNCHTIDWQGNTWYSGNLYIGGISQDDTEAYIANVPKYGQADTDIVLMVKNGTLTWVSKNEFISEIMSIMNN